MGRALGLLAGYTAGQWGMVTTRQARSLGVDDVTLHRLKDAGFLEAVRRGVYAATSSATSEAREEQAAWLSLRPDAPGWERPKLDPDGGVVSHQSAIRLHGLGDLVNDRVEMTVPRRRTKRDPGIWLRQAELTEAEVTIVDGLPVTTPLRTICDLLDQHIDGSHVATIIRQAVEVGQVQLDELAERIGPYARRYGVRSFDGAALLEHLLDQIGLSTMELAKRPTTWGQLTNAGVSWSELKDSSVTWGQLADLSPDIARRIRQSLSSPEFPHEVASPPIEAADTLSPDAEPDDET